MFYRALAVSVVAFMFAYLGIPSSQEASLHNALFLAFSVISAFGGFIAAGIAAINFIMVDKK